VLGRVRTAGKDPAAEGHRMAGWIADGEEDPAPEGVLNAAPPVDEAESGPDCQLLAAPQALAQGVPLVRCPSQSEAADHPAVVAPAAQVVAGLTGVGPGKQAPVV